MAKTKDNAVEKLWTGDDILSNHYATSVEHGGYLYGIHGRTDPGMSPSLRCVSVKDGKVCWDSDTVGAASITSAGDQLLILSERGELIRATASAEAFKPVSRTQLLPFQVRAYPALADGFLFARSKDKLICADMRKGD